MKDRLIRHAIEYEGYRHFAMEANMAGAEAVNDYVLQGIGDPAEAVKGMGFWVWSTQEVVDLVQWMRQYNLQAPEDEKVRFHGFDMQGLQLPVQRFVALLDRLSAERGLVYNLLRKRLASTQRITEPMAAMCGTDSWPRIYLLSPRSTRMQKSWLGPTTGTSRA